jgi:peptide chain release factor 1
VTFRATGPDAVHVFRNESGGHRWQRVPPTEKRGRVHTSTVTVAVLREADAPEVVLDEADLQWSTCRSGKSGGQHMQKTDSAVQVRHRPTGITVRCESERSQHQNRAAALAVLRSRLLAQATAAFVDARNGDRKGQIGSGQRGDKRRTIREADGTVTDHVLGVRIRLAAYERGDWGALVDGASGDE